MDLIIVGIDSRQGKKRGALTTDHTDGTDKRIRLDNLYKARQASDPQITQIAQIRTGRETEDGMVRSKRFLFC
jgi:hypothetical protein